MKWLELNPQYERLTGLSRSEMLSGKTVREIQPSAEDKWFDTYANVVRTQTSVRFEEHSPTLNRWYDVYAFPVGKPELHEVAILFSLYIGNHRLLAIVCPVNLCRT